MALSVCCEGYIVHTNTNTHTHPHIYIWWEMRVNEKGELKSSLAKAKKQREEDRSARKLELFAIECVNWLQCMPPCLARISGLASPFWSSSHSPLCSLYFHSCLLPRWSSIITTLTAVCMARHGTVRSFNFLAFIFTQTQRNFHESLIFPTSSTEFE